MKTSIILFLLAIAVGVAVGGALGYQSYGPADDEFGPFTLEQSTAPEDVEAFLASLEPEGVAKVEVVGGNEFDFGVMRRNAKATHQFVIKNVGTGQLDLKVLGSTCKCTVGSLQASTLAPGESTVVDLEWEAKTNTRSFSQSATLQTTDPTAGEISLKVTGNVVDLLAADPSAWNLGDFDSSTPIELKTTLFNYSPEPVEITEIRWMDDKFQALSTVDIERRETDPAEDGVNAEASAAFDVAVRVQPGTPQGRLHQTLRVEYRTVGETETHPPIEIVLTGRLVGAISVMGGSRLATANDGGYILKLGTAKSGEVEEQKIYVLLRGPLRDDAQLRIGDVKPADALEAELGEASDRGSMRMYPLVVRTREKAPTTDRSGPDADNLGQITIESDHPEVAPIRIGVVFRIGQFGE